jgi:hypothetical protein
MNINCITQRSQRTRLIFAYRLPRLICVSWVGGWVALLLTLFGTGASVQHIYRGRMPRPPVVAMQM